MFRRAMKDKTVCGFNMWTLFREDTTEITLVSVAILWIINEMF